MNMYSPAKNMEKNLPGYLRWLPNPSVLRWSSENAQHVDGGEPPGRKEELDPVISFGCWLVHQCLDWI